MNKRIIFLSIIFAMTLSVLAYAQICEVEGTKEVLRKNIFLHLTSPGASPLTLAEIKDLLEFFLGIPAGRITVDCSGQGTISNQPISTIIEDGDSAPNTIPSCSDGTKYGECSSTKPSYCYGDSLINKCNTCGCPSSYSCGADGRCNPSGMNITCYADLDCGTSQFTGAYYCSGNFVARDYLNYTCSNPGTIGSNCISSASPLMLTYCDPTLNRTCTDGSSMCQQTGDVILPSVSITTPTSGSNVSGASVVVSATASDNIAVVGVQFRLDGANLGAEDINSPYSVIWNTTSTSNGLHTLTAAARDAAGNTNTSAISVIVSNAISDTTQPSVSISTPAQGAIINGTVTVSATATDNVGVVGVQFKLDGANLGNESLSSPYSVSWNTISTTNGLHSLTAAARDAAGNSNTSTAISVNVSNVFNMNPVAVLLINPASPPPRRYTFNGSASFDTDGSVQVYWWKFGDGNQSFANPVLYTYTAAGNYSVNLTVQDNNGAFDSTLRLLNVP
ncbi:MAG: Ig-like domain-containing protein [Nanoarchaeota archaeon]